MGSRGPAPKRSAERRRSSSQPTDSVEINAPRPTAPRADASWHPVARRWYQALKKSGQSQFYEPSDWARAQYIAELISRSLRAPKVPSGLVSAVMSGMSELLDTEGSRRRVGMEIERKQKARLASVAAMDDYRSALGG